MKRVLKATVAGVIAAAAATVSSLIVEFVLTMRVSGGDGLGAVSGDAYYFQFAALAGFVVGFVWQYKRGNAFPIPAPRP
jgi:hypothetical protein